MLGMSPWHLAVLALVGLFVFGPERLPEMIRDLGKALRQVRATAQEMQEDLKAELGPEVGDLDLRSLNPKTFVEKHLFGEDDDPFGLDALRKDTAAAVSFDKPAAVASPEPAQMTPAETEPLTTQPIMTKPVVSPSGFNRVKYDVDAT